MPPRAMAHSAPAILAWLGKAIKLAVFGRLILNLSKPVF
jgi:hypothetical protein